MQEKRQDIGNNDIVKVYNTSVIDREYAPSYRDNKLIKIEIKTVPITFPNVGLKNSLKKTIKQERK